jgi:hypothetical protein
MDNFPVERAKVIEQAADIADHRLHTRAMPVAAFHLHIDDH